jgi:hypothetical protein
MQTANRRRHMAVKDLHGLGRHCRRGHRHRGKQKKTSEENDLGVASHEVLCTFTSRLYAANHQPESLILSCRWKTIARLRLPD